MRKWARVGLTALVVVAAVAACSSKKTDIRTSTAGELANNGFPLTSVAPNKIADAADDINDWIFFNGEEPGRHDPFIDIKHIYLGNVTPDASQLAKLETEIGCGNGTAGPVVCANPPVPLPSGPLFLFTMQMAAPVPAINPAGETGRYSLLIDAGGDAATKAKASPQAPNLASDGTNFLIEAIFGPPTQPGVPSVPGLEINTVDRRKAANEFFTSAARVVFRGDAVIFVVPQSEIGDAFVGARGATLWGNSTATGDAAQNNADVAPGGKTPPFAFIP